MWNSHIFGFITLIKKMYLEKKDTFLIQIFFSQYKYYFD